jgi:hypothetical protein
MSDIINEELSFDEGNNHIAILANKDCKMVVTATWEISRYSDGNDFESSRPVPIRDLFIILRDKDKYIENCAKELCGKDISELRKMFEIKSKELREANFEITKLEDKIKAYKTIMKEMRVK